MKVDPGLHHRLRYTFSMSGKVRNLREPASQALFCYALLSQTNDVERWWNDDENEPLCLVPLYILSINGQTENDIGNDIGTSLRPFVDYYIYSISSPMTL